MAESELGSEEIPWAPCVGYEPEEEGPEGAAGAPVYQSRRWKKNKLKVHFMNEVPSGWRLTKEKVLEWANRWSDPRLKGIVPEFVMEEDMDVSDVRIRFTKGGSESKIGTMATDHEGDPTMWLNLSAVRFDDYREYVVVHEFGHVLGLGHEHQMSHLAAALDEKATIKWLENKCSYDKSGAKAKFRADFKCYPSNEPIKEGIKFDPWSVMCYPIDLECIKDKKRFTSEELEAIKSLDYNQRKKLSDVDVITIQNLYSAG